MDESEKIEIDKYIDWYRSTSIEVERCRIIYVKKQRLNKVITYLERRLMSRFNVKEVVLIYFIAGFSETKILSFSLLNHFKEELKTIKDKLKSINEQVKKYALGYDDFLIPTVTEWDYFKNSRDEILRKNISNFKSRLQHSLGTEKDAAIIDYNYLLEQIEESSFNEIAMAGYMATRSLDFWDFLVWVEVIDFANWLQKTIVQISLTKHKRGSPPIEKQIKTLVLYYYYLEKAQEISLYDEDEFKKVIDNTGISAATLKRARSAMNDINARIGFEVGNPKGNRQREERLKTVIKMLKKNANKKSIKLAKTEFKTLLLRQKQSGKMKIN